MSWIVEESDNTSAVNVNGDTITCTKDGYYGSPVNVMYSDSASENGQYFWQIEFEQMSEQGGASVGFTTDNGFKSGWGLKGMQYLGNLSDGSGLLVSSFGDRIKENDKIGLLLQLSDADLKIYIFHNERPLGLAFHVSSSYSKPLYPVVSFSSNGKVKISRVQQIPTSLERSPEEFTGVEGNWRIIDYLSHPECIDCKFAISKESPNVYGLHAHVVNSMNCSLEYDPANDQWKSSPILRTRKGGPPDAMKKEDLICKLIADIQGLEAQGEQHLVIRTSGGDQVRLERFTVPAPQPVTQNIFD